MACTRCGSVAGIQSGCLLSTSAGLPQPPLVEFAEFICTSTIATSLRDVDTYCSTVNAAQRAFCAARCPDCQRVWHPASRDSLELFLHRQGDRLRLHARQLPGDEGREVLSHQMGAPLCLGPVTPAAVQLAARMLSKIPVWCSRLASAVMYLAACMRPSQSTALQRMRKREA